VAGTPFALPDGERSILTADGKTLLVSDYGSATNGTLQYGDTVTPVNAATGSAGQPIKVSEGPSLLVLSPDGRTCYVETNSGVFPIDVASGKVGPVISPDSNVNAMAISPDGHTLYLADSLVSASGDSTVTAVNVSSRQLGKPIVITGSTSQPSNIAAIEISPDGRMLYLANVPLSALDSTIIPIDTATGAQGKPVQIQSPVLAALAITPDGKTLYVASVGGDSNGQSSSDVTPVSLATDTAGSPIRTGTEPDALAIAPDGGTLFVGDGKDDTVTPVTIPAGTPGLAVKVGDPVVQVVLGDNAKTLFTLTGKLLTNPYLTVTPVSLFWQPRS